jgi:ABC-2 type transport system permease protein
MFFHVFLYRLKCILRNRIPLFWSLLFPIILATLFKFTFANIYAAAQFSSIPVAVVEDEGFQKNAYFGRALDSVSNGNARSPGEKSLFAVTPVETIAAAEALLSEGKVSGYIAVDPDIRMVARKSGLGQSILKAFLDQYAQASATFEAVLARDPGASVADVLKSVGGRNDYLRSYDLSEKKLDDTLINFFALIAMACLAGSFWGMRIVVNVQADQSPRGARINMAPLHKMRVLLAELAASLLVHFGGLCLLVLYMAVALKISFGGQVAYVLLAAFAAAAAGISFGAFVGAAGKGGMGVKSAILIGATTMLSMFAGMYSASIKYAIAKAFPLAAYINPAALVSDAFYALYYYDTPRRFFLNVILLGAFSAIFGLMTYLLIRRTRYASIPNLLHDN